MIAPTDLLVDRFGRQHTKLRVSVTDRCNLRCHYCMPAAGMAFAPRNELLTFEEMERVIRIAVGLGVRQVRLTGGEPLVRHELYQLVRRLATIPHLEDISLTTNAVLLEDQAQELRDAGVKRVNISLDALDPTIFKEITRRDNYDQVIAGIHASQRVGFDPIKINVVSLRGVTESQVELFGQFTRKTGLEVRFIEYMPLDASKQWERDKVLLASEVRSAMEEAIMPMRPIAQPTGSPATEYEFIDGTGRIGFIPTVSQPFCDSCDRFRITAEGKLRSCLFSLEEMDVRELLRGGATDAQVADLLQQSIRGKWAGHKINTDDFLQPERGMSAIGG